MKSLSYEETYKYLEENFFAFAKEAGVYSSNYEGIIVAHGDKGERYKDIWETNGVPYHHGMMLYLLSYLSPFDTQMVRYEVHKWVIKNYPKFRHLLDGNDPADEVIWRFCKHHTLPEAELTEEVKSLIRFAFNIGYGKGFKRIAEHEIGKRHWQQMVNPIRMCWQSFLAFILWLALGLLLYNEYAVMSGISLLISLSFLTGSLYLFKKY